MIVPEFIYQLRRHALQLLCKAIFTGNLKALFQRRRYHFPMLLLILPQVGASGIFTAARIGYIKYIFQSWLISGGIDQRNSQGTMAHIPVHLLIPKVIVRTGCCLRTLGEDHKLFMVGVFIQPRSCFQKSCPHLITAGDLLCSSVCQLAVLL